MKLLTTLLATSAVLGFADFKVPPVPKPVNDYAHVMTSNGINEATHQTVELQQISGAQMGVLIVESLEGIPLEEATMKVARTWKLGSKERDDGILLFLAVKDHKMRFEIGYGLEGVFPDVYAKRVLVGMQPYLRAGDYDGAVNYGVLNAAMQIASRKDEITSKTHAAEPNPMMPVIALIFLGGIIFWFLMMRRQIKRDEEEHNRRVKEWQEEEQRLLLVKRRQVHKDIAEKQTKNKVKSKKKTKKSSKASRSLAQAYLEDDRRETSSSFTSFYDSDSSYDSGSSDSGSSWDGGGGDFGGGGSSDSW